MLSGGLAPGRREGGRETRGGAACEEERALKHKHPVKDRLVEAFHTTLAASTLFWRPLRVELHTFTCLPRVAQVATTASRLQFRRVLIRENDRTEGDDWQKHSGGSSHLNT